MRPETWFQKIVRWFSETRLRVPYGWRYTGITLRHHVWWDGVYRIARPAKRHGYSWWDRWWFRSYGVSYGFEFIGLTRTFAGAVRIARRHEARHTAAKNIEM